jgi:hypothetical protein
MKKKSSKEKAKANARVAEMENALENIVNSIQAAERYFREIERIRKFRENKGDSDALLFLTLSQLESEADKALKTLLDLREKTINDVLETARNFSPNGGWDF